MNTMLKILAAIMSLVFICFLCKYCYNAGHEKAKVIEKTVERIVWKEYPLLEKLDKDDINREASSIEEKTKQTTDEKYLGILEDVSFVSVGSEGKFLICMKTNHFAITLWGQNLPLLLYIEKGKAITYKEIFHKKGRLNLDGNELFTFDIN